MDYLGVFTINEFVGSSRLDLGTMFSGKGPPSRLGALGGGKLSGAVSRPQKFGHLLSIGFKIVKMRMRVESYVGHLGHFGRLICQS